MVGQKKRGPEARGCSLRHIEGKVVDCLCGVSITSRISAATYLLGVMAKFSSVISPSLSDCSMSVFFSSMMPSVPYSAVCAGAAGASLVCWFPMVPIVEAKVFR